MNRTLAVDCGKYATKAAIRDVSRNIRKRKFRTKMDLTEEVKANDPRSSVLEYEGQKYMIGDEAEYSDFNKSKSQSIHMLATYAAIAQLIKSGESANLVIGCPISVYNNVEERMAYKEFMMGNKKVDIRINDKPFIFTINDILVCPEGSGVIYKDPKKYKDKTVGIIDIGGLNTNHCIYSKLTPIKSASFTTNLGANILSNELMQKLNSEFKDVNIQEYLMENIIKDGFIRSYPERSKALIEEFRLDHIKKIVYECTKKGWDIKNIDIVVQGGGSRSLQEEIKTLIPHVEFSEDVDFANALGMLEVGGIKFGV